jgi:hypothetical protein
MKLTVHDHEGALLAEVDVDPRCAADPDFVHIVGRFSPGPEFGRVKSMIDEFEKVYATGDRGASHKHEQIDRLGLVATSGDSVRYAVFNVYFRDGDLLFSVSREPSRVLK